jgi:hypothetical protein
VLGTRDIAPKARTAPVEERGRWGEPALTSGAVPSYFTRCSTTLDFGRSASAVVVSLDRDDSYWESGPSLHGRAFDC